MYDFAPVALKDQPETIWVMTTKGGTVVDPVKYSGTNVLVRIRSSKVDGRRMWWAPMSMLHLTPTENPRVLTKAKSAKNPLR